MLTNSFIGRREYLLVSDFDQTLSYDDSGEVLSELLGITDFQRRVSGLSDIHLVQQGGELAYLLLHDPSFGACAPSPYALRLRLRPKSEVPFY